MKRNGARQVIVIGYPIGGILASQIQLWKLTMGVLVGAAAMIVWSGRGAIRRDAVFFLRERAADLERA